MQMLPLYHDPHFTFRFADDRIIPRFHLEDVEAGRRVAVYKIDPESGERLGLPMTARVGEGGWVDLRSRSPCGAVTPSLPCRTRRRWWNENPLGSREPSGSCASFPKSSGPGSPRRKQPELRQHILNRLADPHGQRSFPPTFSCSSLSPWTTRTPRFTFVSEGKPQRRLLIVSKRELVVEVLRVHVAPPFPVE